MGVHGLTTYLREKKRLLSTTTNLPAPSPGSVPIVVDGWSFIYDLYQHSGLPWVYGGEYIEFVRLVKNVVEAWIKIGFHVYFVFDGACPDLKFPTLVSRLAQSHVQPAQLFFRTSTTSRSTSRFLNENRILPPLAYSACIHALDALKSSFSASLELHFADEEGDPYAVELAGRLGGYVVGNDSDFVILNSEGYLGYIPLDEMVWQTPTAEEPSLNDDADDDFQTVKKPKAKKKVPSNLQNLGGLLPPEGAADLSLSFISYSPDAVAKYLNIPTSLLPLLGALVGNDFSRETESTSRKIQALFFERQLTLSQRIEKVANALRTVISPGGTQKRKAKHQVGSVMDLIDRTVNALLARQAATMGTGEIEAIIDKVVNATLQYAIPKYTGDMAGRAGLWPTSVCALHEPEICTILPMISHNVMRQAEKSEGADPKLLEARAKYLDAYRSGQFMPKSMDILSTGSSWPRIFLENPDLETVGRSIGQPIREWVYTVLNDTVGLPAVEFEAETSVRDESTESIDGSNAFEEDEESDPDELIDVVESDSDDDGPTQRDYLAPLKGELNRLHSNDLSDSDEDEEEEDGNESATEPPVSIISHRNIPANPVVTDYLRRGTRIASEPINIKPLSEMLESLSLAEYGHEDAPPLVLRSEEDRLTIFLRILKSDTNAVRQLDPERILVVLAARWITQTLHTRWEESDNKEREKERWTKHEAKCLLASLTCAAPPIDTSTMDTPQIDDRNIQLTAQVLMALDSIEQLSQVLLLTGRILSNAHRFSGKVFHALLTGTHPVIPPPHEDAWEATESGMGNAFQLERMKKVKKSKNEKTAPAPVGRKARNIDIYALLGNMDV
ncbi:hypothetical protein D9619_001924 [Psilocybe cf. subviscida]|uniref:Asteroid domain-containing protein n=1 Tax=Psilocybe cf. subviscida TaxID=2480587 RepID=A0A8H5BFP8_9AGAR|nr:hypothetical protein D9619_001924 [Psilocybe cf. subviscida]